MTQIAQFFAKVGILIENKEFAKVDQALKNVEKQLGKVVGGSTKETKAKKEATTATEKKAKAVEKETKATKDLNKEQEKQSKDIARRIKQQQAILKKADAEALKQANAFLTLQKKLANANPGLKTLSQKQIAANRAAFFSNARASDIRTGQGLQYRLGAQADTKIRQMLAGQNALLASRSIVSPVSNNNKVFEELQLRLASKLRTPRHLTESQINKNRAAFFSSARILETKTGQGLQYRLGDQVAKIQQATQKQQEQAAVNNQRQARRVSDTVDKGLRDLERELQRAFSPVQNATARRNIRRAADGLNTPRASGGGVRGGESGGGGTSGGRSAASYSRANFLHAGGAGGALARYGVESLPFIGGAYGMVQLNQANQNMMSANIAAESVLGPEAKARMDWLSQRANYLGVNYAETLPQFTKFMASASPLLGGDAAQETFSSFMQFGRTRGATSVSMNRALNAVSQMSAKGQIMQEELKGQLAEASGFGELPQLFAEAYQIKTGGSLKGADARAALMKAMEDGLVKSDILPLVASLMNELSKGGIEKARTSSIAEQERAQNALTGRGGLLQTFSQAGGEEGFARFWRETAKIFQEMKPLVQGLAGAFNDLTRVMQPLRMVFEGWNNILESTSELTGLSTTRLVELAAVGGLMASKWGRVATMFTAIMLVIEDIAFGMAGKKSLTKDFLNFLEAEGLSSGQAKFAAIAAALTAVATALALISRNSMLPGIGDVLGKGGSKGGNTAPSRFKMPWEKLAGAAVVGAAGAGAYYVGTNGLPSTNVWNATGADLVTSMGMGAWLGGPLGAAAGGIWSLGNPTWGSNLQMPKDEFGFQNIPAQDNDALVKAMMASRFRSSEQPLPIETNVSIRVDANITAQDAQGFSENLKLEIDKALGNYNISQ